MTLQLAKGALFIFQKREKKCFFSSFKEKVLTLGQGCKLQKNKWEFKTDTLFM